MDRLSKGAKPTQGKGGKPGPFGKGKDSKPEPGGSGEGGGGSNGGKGPTWSDAGQAALLIAGLIAYNSFGASGGGSAGRVETIEFQTFRNSVLAKDIVDKVCSLSMLAPIGQTLLVRMHRGVCYVSPRIMRVNGSCCARSIASFPVSLCFGAPVGNRYPAMLVSTRHHRAGILRVLLSIPALHVLEVYVSRRLIGARCGANSTVSNPAACL